MALGENAPGFHDLLGSHLHHEPLGSGFRVLGVWGFRVQGFRGLGVWGSGFRVQSNAEPPGSLLERSWDSATRVTVDGQNPA